MVSGLQALLKKKHLSEFADLVDREHRLHIGVIGIGYIVPETGGKLATEDDVTTYKAELKLQRSIKRRTCLSLGATIDELNWLTFHICTNGEAANGR